MSLISIVEDACVSELLGRVQYEIYEYPLKGMIGVKMTMFKRHVNGGWYGKSYLVSTLALRRAVFPEIWARLGLAKCRDEVLTAYQGG